MSVNNLIMINFPNLKFSLYLSISLSSHNSAL